MRRLLTRRQIRAVIPRRREQKRNRVERLVNRLKQHRRIATRDEKRAGHDLAMLTLGAVLLWL